MLPLLLFTIINLTIISSISAIEFLFNSFTPNTTPVINLTTGSDNNQFPVGRFFYPTPIPIKSTSNSTSISSSFSTQFVFSIHAHDFSIPGFGLAFVLSATTSPPGALAGQYFGLFSNATVNTVAPLIAVEFDTGRNPEWNDPDRNHVGIDLNSPESVVTHTAGYYNSSDSFVPIVLRNGTNIHAWIEFNGPDFEINVTIAPAGMSRPVRTMLSYKDPIIANYTSADMYVGFSASRTLWVEEQRVLAWSFSDSGDARDIDTTNLSVFRPENSPSSLSRSAIAGIVVACVTVVLGSLCVLYWWKRRRNKEENDVIEDWELEYWPHRYSYEELSQATKGFSKDELLGFGGFGKVYKGILSNSTEVAVKCVSHDSRQGIREFMAEISTIGRLQHKNLVQMRGWCIKGNELMIVYGYMPNGSLNKWIFDNPEKNMNWVERKKVLADIAEGLNYLHHGWEQVVLHRDIKSSNVLLDSEMRGRLGDFGLAKLYTHGGVPDTTRVIGTLGYFAPEVVTRAKPTAASDVYSFGVVVLEVACGRKPVDTGFAVEEEVVLIDWVRQKYREGRLCEVADDRIQGQHSEDEMESVLKLGLTCCDPDPLRRPTMGEVVAVLLGENVETMPNYLLDELKSTGTNTVERSGSESEEDNEASQDSQPVLWTM